MEGVYALRGATTVDEDRAEKVDEAVREMMDTIYRENGISDEDIAFAHFSQTKDIRSRNAAAASRRGGFTQKRPIFCTQEADIDGALRLCIRVLILINHPREKEPVMVYLRGAKALRPDWASKN